MRSRQLIKGSLLNTVNLIAQVVSGFYVMPLMIHTFGDAMFGLWILVASFMGYAAILDLGLPSAVTRFIAQAIGRGGKECDREIKSITATAFYIFILITVLTFVFIAVVIVTAPLFLKTQDQVEIFRTLLLILCINNLFVFPASVFDGMLAANLRYDLVNSTKIVFTAVKIGFTVLLIKLEMGLVAIAWATVVCNIAETMIRVGLSYGVDRRISISPVNFRRPMVAQLFGYSVYTFIGKIADMMRFQIDASVITVFSDVANVTPFRVASRLVEYFMQLISGVTGVLSPYFSQEEGRQNFEGIRTKFLFITKIIAYFAAFVGGILVLYGKDFIQKWMGAEYGISYEILVVLVVPITLALIQSAVFPLLYGISKHQFVAYVNVGEGLLNLVLSVVLIKKFGILGVALGTAIPLIITKLFIQPIYVSRVLGLSLGRYFLTIGKPLVISVLALAVPWVMIAPHVEANYKTLLFFVTMQSVVFGAAVLLFGFTKLEKTYMSDIVGFKKLFSKLVKLFKLVRSV